MTDIVPKPPEATPLPNDTTIEIGQWYWVKQPKNKPDWFACVVEVGSNYVAFKSPGTHGGYSNDRIHFDDFHKNCRLEPDPDKVIHKHIDKARTEVRHKLEEVKKITARLGFEAQAKADKPETRALSVLSGTDDVKKYKLALIKAKDKQLPKLFEEIESAHGVMAQWMKAQAMPMLALAQGMKGAIAEIEDRVFNISLYAGLTEQVTRITDGEPAGAGEKLHLFQRLLFMDEECLVNYRLGGMDFDNIKDFDQWLAEPENLNRCLPSPRCMVAFRVRRHKKERDWGGSLETAWINMQMGDLDETTFLYIRNGEQLYRMNCELDFDTLIFPGKNEFNLSEPMMAKMFCDDTKEIITKREYDVLVANEEERKKKLEAWRKANPEKEWIDEPSELRNSSFEFDQYQPFDKTSVYFDQISETLTTRMKYYNRIALIIQGLYDRSMVLHPHPPVKLWDGEGFANAVELVYDAMTLHHGEPPDFEAYRKKLNASLCDGAITIGQDDYFAEKEADKDNARDWRGRNSDRYQPSRHYPYGNPGPGYLAKIAKWNKKSRTAFFRWERERQWTTYRGRRGDKLPATLKVPETRLFCVDNYQPGDWKQFYADPRTRANYLKWANLLLTAEEFHAGHIELGGTRKPAKKHK